MDKKVALIISLGVLVAFWYVTDFIFNIEIGGFNLPIIGHISGWKPLLPFSQYSGLIAGGFAIIVLYIMIHKGDKNKI